MEKIEEKYSFEVNEVLNRERQLREQLEEAARIGGFEWFVDTNKFWWSDQVSNIIKAKEEIQPSLQALISTIHPSEQRRVQNILEEKSQAEENFRIHTKTLTSKGEETPILLSGTFVKNENKYIGYLQDISIDYNERIALKDTLAKYRGVMAGAGDAIILLTLEGRILEGNIKAAELLEVGQQHISDLSVDDIHRQEDLDKMMAEYQGILWGNSKLIESTIIGRKGRVTPVEISGRPVDTGTEQVLVIILHDITLQQEVQNNLKMSEKRYRSLVDGAKEGIFLLNELGRIVAVNPRVCETIGLKRTELIGAPFENVADFEMEISPIEILRNSSTRHSMHMEGNLKTHSDDYVPTGFNVARYEEQEETQFIVTAYDLTDVRSGEEDRLQLQKQLFQAQKQELLGQLAGSLAHDFNNLLSPILLVSEMLIEDATGDPLLEKNLNNINQAAQRARRLVGRILDYTRPEESEPSQIDLREELEDSLELLRLSVPHTIKITDTYGADKYDCFADPDQINQVIMNIGMNAAQSIGETNGKIDFLLDIITVDEESELMNKYELPEGDYAQLCVKDTGVGIPDEYLEEIFDPFFTTKTQTDGSGLGLSVVTRIVTNHGGIAVASNNDTGGACISVYLPLA